MRADTLIRSATGDDRLRVGRGVARAEDAQGTPTQSYISPSRLVSEEKYRLALSLSELMVVSSPKLTMELGSRVSDLRFPQVGAGLST